MTSPIQTLEEEKVAIYSHQADSLIYTYSGDLQAEKKTSMVNWSYMTPDVLMDTRCH